MKNKLIGIIAGLLLYALPTKLMAQQHIFELQVAPKINLDKIGDLQQTFRPLSNVSLSYYYLPDSLNFGIGIQYEYFSEKVFNELVSFILRYNAVKMPIYFQNYISKNLSINIKAGPAWYFPLLIDERITGISIPTNHEKGRLGVYSALGIVVHNKTGSGLGLNVIQNAVLQNISSFNEDYSFVTPRFYSHVSVALSLYINFN